MKKIIPLFFFLLLTIPVVSQTHSVAREWNEQLLFAIRNDFARPTVHARNLFHTSIAMYDAWAVFSDEAETFFPEVILQLEGKKRKDFFNLMIFEVQKLEVGTKNT